MTCNIHNFTNTIRRAFHITQHIFTSFPEFLFSATLSTVVICIYAVYREIVLHHYVSYNQNIYVQMEKRLDKWFYYHILNSFTRIQNVESITQCDSAQKFNNFSHSLFFPFPLSKKPDNNTYKPPISSWWLGFTYIYIYARK